MLELIIKLPKKQYAVSRIKEQGTWYVAEHGFVFQAEEVVRRKENAKTKCYDPELLKVANSAFRFWCLPIPQGVIHTFEGDIQSAIEELETKGLRSIFRKNPSP